MADESTEESTPEETTSTDESTETSEETTDNSTAEETKVTPEDDWQAKARKHEDSAKKLRSELKALKPLADKAKSLEDANKSEAEKLTDRVTTAEQDLATAKTEAAKLRVAIKYDLSEEDLDFLGSGDEDQIEERAKRLSERLKSKQDAEETEEKPEVKRRPTERTKRTGATSRTEPDETDPAKLAAGVSRDY
jgi:hypothetical protein